MENVAPESVFMLTPSEVIEHLYCPRFTYFMHCLNIPQHEEQRYKVLKGRELHENRAGINKTYARRKLNCVSKDISVYLASAKIHVRGVVDEVLHLADGSACPLDYKFTEHRDYLFATHKIQSILYAGLIREVYRKPVTRGYVCYIRGCSVLKEIVYQPSDFTHAEEVITEMAAIITRGYYPKKTRSANKCFDCCYKNICV